MCPALPSPWALIPPLTPTLSFHGDDHGLHPTRANLRPSWQCLSSEPKKTESVWSAGENCKVGYVRTVGSCEGESWSEMKENEAKISAETQILSSCLCPGHMRPWRASMSPGSLCFFCINPLNSPLFSSFYLQGHTVFKIVLESPLPLEPPSCLNWGILKRD